MLQPRKYLHLESSLNLNIPPYHDHGSDHDVKVHGASQLLPHPLNIVVIIICGNAMNSVVAGEGEGPATLETFSLQLPSLTINTCCCCWI